MTAAARAQHLSEGSPCNIGSTAAKPCLVQVSLGPVQEDGSPQEAYSTRVALMSRCARLLLPGGVAAWQPAARWQQGGPATVGQLHTEPHDFKQSRIK